MSKYHGAAVESADHREYGKAVISVVHNQQNKDVGGHVDLLFEGVENDITVGNHVTCHKVC